MEILQPGHEKFERLEKLHKLSQSIRGAFLDQAIAVEMLCSDIIAQHFCPEVEKRYMFFSLVLSGGSLSFSSKTRIFRSIMKMCYPDLLEKFPELKVSLEKIRKFRNRIAHSMLDSSEEFLDRGYEDRIRVEFYKEGKMRKQVISKSDARKRLAECSKVVVVLTKIQTEVIARVEKEQR